jgi:hypothetical protein
VKIKKEILSVVFPSIETVENALRVPNGRKQEIHEEFDSAWRVFLSLKVTPFALFSTFRIQKDSSKESAVFPLGTPEPDMLSLEPHIPFPFSPEYAKAYHSLLIALITLGPELENAVSEAFRDGESFKGWILDRMGTLLLRKAFAIFLSQRKQATEGYFGPRYAPGCPPIPLAGQKRIFDLLDASREGMRLTQGYMICPIKTTTFVLGIGAHPILNEHSLCQTCRRASICKDEAEESIF